MIRVVIVAAVLVAAAVLFLPQTVAALPGLEGVVGALASDVAGVRDGALSWASGMLSGALSWATDMLSGALSRVGAAAADALPDAIAGAPR